MKALAPLDVETVPLSGVTLIEASAGTGKTHTIATLFLRLLLESDLALSEILVVTYTRAATAELRLRIRQRLGEALEVFEGHGVGSDPVIERMAARARARAQTAAAAGRLTEALRSFDEAAIFTIHGFCQRVLRRHAFESGMPFEAELREDQALLIEEVVSDYWAEHLAKASESFVAALEANRVTIDSLVRLLKRAAGNPELHVVPKAMPLPTAELERAYAAAGGRVAELWTKHGREIEAQLARPGLNAGTYGRGRLRALFDDVLPHAAQLSAHDVHKHKGVENLTPQGLASKCNKGHLPPQHPFFDACAQWWALASQLRAALDQHVLAFQHTLLEFARGELARRGDDAGQLGFDDLLSHLSAALQGAQGDTLIQTIRHTHKAALIDEFQDTDPVQCEVFRRIYATALPNQPVGSLFLIGDPKQAIYAFRGADVFAYVAAARSAVDHAYTLTVNYRSDPSLLRGVDRLFARAKEPFVFPDIAYRSVRAAASASDRLQGAGAPFEILLVSRAAGRDDSPLPKGPLESELPRRLAAEISQLLGSAASIDGRAVEPRQVAVLCRTNQQALNVQVALREVGIPAVLDGDSSVFDSSMADELARWLWAMVEPADAARVRAALATTGLGVNAAQLLALEQDERAWDAWVSRFHALQELWHANGFMRALHALCDELAVPARLLALPDGERRYTDLMHLAELLHAQVLRSRQGPRALLDWYRRVRAGEAQRVGMAREDVQIRLESDARAVTLTTIHKSKGLQFPIVYCPFAWDGTLLHKAERKSPLFHDPEQADQLTLVLGSPDAMQLAAANREALAENLRLLYVALTRAKHRLSVVWGALGNFESSALAYLLHQPENADLSSLAQNTIERAKGLSDAALRADLERLQVAAEGAIGVRDLLAVGAARAYLSGRSVPQSLAPRIAKRRALDSLHIGSFSRLAANASAAEPVALDRDELDDSASSEPVAVHAPDQVALALFPAGAAFGHLIHAIYETADFQASDPAALHSSVEGALREYGAPTSWKEPLSSAILATLHTPLPAADSHVFTLASVTPQRRLSELEFLFPVAAAEPKGVLLSPERLANVLLAHARNAGERDYARQLGKLRFVPFAGFLRGFIDLVVEHAGRFYVIDYKSNRLGPLAADYTADRLLAVMHRHHYALQYLLYSVALHRYLMLRSPAYDYDQHFGGACYLFVRGMHPEYSPGNGIFFDRPARALIEQLSQLMSDPAQNGLITP